MDSHISRERRNPVSAHVLSHSKRSLLLTSHPNPRGAFSCLYHRGSRSPLLHTPVINIHSVRLQQCLTLWRLTTHIGGRNATLTSKVAFYIFIQQMYVLNILNTVYNLHFFPLQNAVCFIILTYLDPVLFTFYIQDVLKLKEIWCQKVNRQNCYFKLHIYSSLR